VQRLKLRATLSVQCSSSARTHHFLPRVCANLRQRSYRIFGCQPQLGGLSKEFEDGRDLDPSPPHTISIRPLTIKDDSKPPRERRSFFGHPEDSNLLHLVECPRLRPAQQL
jgi:hypothetical protein